MQSTTESVALLPAGQQIRQGWVLLSLVALLALLMLIGASMARIHSAALPAGGQMAASNGDVVIGSTMAAPIGDETAAKTGDVHIGSMAAPIGSQTAATNGDIHVNTATNGDIQVGG